MFTVSSVRLTTDTSAKALLEPKTQIAPLLKLAETLCVDIVVGSQFYAFCHVQDKLMRFCLARVYFVMSGQHALWAVSS